MKILAVEFSSNRRSVAVAESQNDGAVAVLGTASEAHAPKTRALTMVEQALAQARIEREEIDCVAVGLGPGSYTGIRASISLAQGWQLARGVKLVGVGSVDSLVAQALAEGVRGSVNFVIDAQRNEFYLAAYELGPQGARAVENLRLASIEEIERRLNTGEVVLGPDANRWFPEARDFFPEAATLTHLAAQRSVFLPGEELEPIYLREVRFVKAPPPRFPPGGPTA